MGFMEESPVARLYRDVKINEIGEGPARCSASSSPAICSVRSRCSRPTVPTDAVIVAAARTPFGKLGGGSPRCRVDLGARVIREVLERSGTDPPRSIS